MIQRPSLAQTSNTSKLTSNNGGQSNETTETDGNHQPNTVDNDDGQLAEGSTRTASKKTAAAATSENDENGAPPSTQQSTVAIIDEINIKPIASSSPILSQRHNDDGTEQHNLPSKSLNNDDNNIINDQDNQNEHLNSVIKSINFVDISTTSTSTSAIDNSNELIPLSDLSLSSSSSSSNSQNEKQGPNKLNVSSINNNNNNNNQSFSSSSSQLGLLNLDLICDNLTQQESPLTISQESKDNLIDDKHKEKISNENPIILASIMTDILNLKTFSQSDPEIVNSMLKSDNGNGINEMIKNEQQKQRQQSSSSQILDDLELRFSMDDNQITPLINKNNNNQQQEDNDKNSTFPYLSEGTKGLSQQHQEPLSADNLNQSTKSSTNALGSESTNQKSRQSINKKPMNNQLTMMDQRMSIKQSNLVTTTTNVNNIKKRKSNNFWTNMISVPYKQKCLEFNRLFQKDIGHPELLIGEFYCALNGTQTGRIYISKNHIAFYHNIMGLFTKTLCWNCADIVSINKANAALVIPNAIQIIIKSTTGTSTVINNNQTPSPILSSSSITNILSDDKIIGPVGVGLGLSGGVLASNIINNNNNEQQKYLFTSFTQRDKTYSLMEHVWKRSMAKNSLTNQEIYDYVRQFYGDDLGFLNDGEETQLFSTMETVPVSVSEAIETSNIEQPKSNESGLDNIVDNNPSSSCCSSYEERTLFDKSIDDVDDQLMSTTSTNFNDNNTSCDDLPRHQQTESIKQVNQINQTMSSKYSQRQDKSCSSSGQSISPPPTTTATQSSELSSSTSSSTKVIKDENIEDKNGRGNGGEGGVVDASNDASTGVTASGSSKSRTNSDVSIGTNNFEPSASKSPLNRFFQQASLSLVEGKCRCTQHIGTLMLEEIIPFPVDYLFELLFVDQNFIRYLHKLRHTSGLKIGHWMPMQKKDLPKIPFPDENIANGCEYRTMKYTVKLTGLPLVNSAMVTEQQYILQSDPNRAYCLMSQINNEGIPYADSFVAISTWCLNSCLPENNQNGQDEEDNSIRLPTHTKIMIYFHVYYLKNSFSLSLMKSTIEKNSATGFGDFLQHLMKLIRTKRFDYMKQSMIFNESSTTTTTTSSGQQKSTSVSSFATTASTAPVTNVSDCKDPTTAEEEEEEVFFDGTKKLKKSKTMKAIQVDDKELDGFDVQEDEELEPDDELTQTIPSIVTSIGGTIITTIQIIIDYLRQLFINTIQTISITGRGTQQQQQQDSYLLKIVFIMLLLIIIININLLKQFYDVDHRLTEVLDLIEQSGRMLQQSKASATTTTTTIDNQTESSAMYSTP